MIEKLKDEKDDVLRPDYSLSPPRQLSRSEQLVDFFTPALFKRSSPQKLRSTAYLDGIRGLAAFVVYIAHNLLSANGLMVPIEVAWGFEGNYYLINFPFLRMLFTGSHASVPIFFIISGYVNARKALQMIHDNDPNVFAVLASGIFRRGFRLLIPVLGTAFCFMTLWHLLGVVPYMGHYEETYWLDFKYFFVNMWYWTYIFKTNDIKLDEKHIVNQWFAYNGHTWTVPIELQGSFHVLILLLVFSRAPARTRITMLAITSFYFLLEGGVYWFCFPMGAVLCELDLTSKFDSFILPANVSWRNQFFWALLALGLYLGGVPVRGFATMSPVLVADQPGFYYLSYLIPRIYFDVTHFLGTISALCIVTATIALSPLHKFFEMRFFQYLGRISFSLYLCHGPILCTLGMFLYKVVGKSTDSPSDWNNAFAIPMIGPKGIELPVLAANLIILPVTLYASELCLRLFDGPSIHFANWAWQRVNQS